MPADEVSTGSDVDAARVRTTGPRHAAPKKPLFTRLHMPAGKAIALAAMPTAVLMGMGFTPTLANADDQPASKSLTIDEYKDCVAALADQDASPSASPSPSASAGASDDADDSKSDSKDSKDESTDGSAGSKDDAKDPSGGSSSSGSSGSSGSGSGDTAEPAPSASSSPDKSATSGDTATTSPSDTGKNVLETIGDAITDLFDGKTTGSASGSDATATSSPSPSASASAPADDSSGTDTGSGTGSAGKEAAKDTAKNTAATAEDTAKDGKDAKGSEKKADDDATASPSPSESASASPSESASPDADGCPVATDDEGGIDNKGVRLPDDPWFLNASSLLLKGADYQGIVKVKTANGTVKDVLKYVVSDGTDIGDLHQTVDDKQAGRIYHVQAGKGTTSTIRNGNTIMYTESISGNLFGLIPVTFTPKTPPPLNIPLIYFTNVKVQQAGQLGGTLTVPGLHQYTTAG
ncbi:hypothetical protein SAMN04487983_1014131 [Streptomyces sp. yr375]|uniref:hypothetical protein n=1 Tax=Streptomyces sp. yr375 TaxID=1761906 RepID=UPI0008B0298F|nr:hypothetical protein [Streptomyces sp. yr375]SER32348.1 hypothetical protein SAMN04487983_1014131 [Streptomyces sp. yr375]